MKTFIFNEIAENWVEEENSLLLHDLVIFLDEKGKKLYLWLGPKSKSKKQKLGIKTLSEIKNKYNNFDLVVLEKEIPPEIEKRLKFMLKKYAEPQNLVLFRDIYLNLYILLALAGIGLSIAFLVTLGTWLVWSPINGNFQIDAALFGVWLFISQLLMLICMCVFIANSIISLIIYRGRFIIVGFIGLITSIGLFIYILEGTYLFLFQQGSTSSIYLISIVDLVVFLLVNIIGVVIIIIPYINQIIYIHNDSITREDIEI